MADIETDRIKVVIEGDDKPARKALDDAIAALDNLEKKATGTGKATREAFDKITDAAEKGGAESKKAVETLAATLERTHPIADKLADAASRAGKALEGKLANGAKAAGKALLKLSVWPLVGPLKAVTGAFAKFGSAVSRLFSKIKSVIMYRAIRSAIRMVTDGFKEGTANAYQWSKAMGGEFAAKMDMLATSSLYLKNSLGALVTPLINAVAPAIDYVVDKFIDLLNIANQVIALLTGASSWTKAVKYPKEYAAAANDAAGSAGKLAKAMTTILAIDELNPLNADKGSGGGGGGGTGSALDYSSMFEEQSLAVSTSLSNMFEPFREAWETKGKGVTDAFHNALSGIQFLLDAVGTSFWEVWTNGTGTETVEHILGILTGILDTIGNISKKFAEGWNTNNLGTTIIQNLWNILNDILGLWDRIATSTANWAANLNFVPILTAFSNLSGAFEKLAKVVTGALGDAWEKVILPLGKWLIESALPTVIEALAAVIDTLATVLQGLADAIEKLKKLTLPQWLQGILGGTLATGGSVTDVPQAAAGATLGVKFQVTDIVDKIPGAKKVISGLNGWIEKRKLGEKVTLPIGGLTGGITKRTLGDKLLAPISGLTGILAKRTFKSDAVQGLFTNTNMSATINSRKFINDNVKTAILAPESVLNVVGRKYSNDTVKNAVQQPEAAINVVAVKGMPTTFDKSINFTSYTFRGENSLSAVLNVKSLKINGQNYQAFLNEAGGAFYNGSWHNIPQYAGGGLPDHGSLFVAGEAGAEIVGHVGGRTEVLNQSQLASTMAAATQMGMASQNGILQQIASGISQLVEGQGDVRAYIPAGEVVTGLQRNNRRDGRALVPMGV